MDPGVKNIQAYPFVDRANFVCRLSYQAKYHETVCNTLKKNDDYLRYIVLAKNFQD